jgi:predicted esterase
MMSEIKFIELQNELFSLFETRNFDDIYSLINKAEVEFPERLDKISFWKACVLSNQGKYEKAIAILSEGLQKGVWWNPLKLTRDPDLNSLQHHEEFKLIIKKCEDILESNRHNSKLQLFTYGNPKSDIGIFSLHWRGSNVKDFAPYWFDDNRLNDYLFGFPQSSQIYGYNAYCWDNKDIALEDITTSFQEFKEKNNVKHQILSGASQGGRLSIEFCLNNSLFDTKGFIAVIPAIHDVSSIENLLKDNRTTNLKGCIITGDKDPSYPKVLELISIFEAYEFQCKLIVKEGLGHYFPNDFADLLTEAVDYLLR